MPGAASGGSWTDRLDRGLAATVEGVAALIVLAEIAILLAGVTARYVFHAPLVWSDELASILFLWLSMLGAVVALRRGEHMRMTGLVSRVGPTPRALLETLAITAPIAFLAMILHPALDYAMEEQFIVTPALEISNAWRAAALPTGLGLMAVVALIRLMRMRNLRITLAAVALTAAVTVAFWLAGPVLKPLGQANLEIGRAHV